MKVLLLYKGDYGSALRGPELRYVQLAQELTALGHKVVISGRRAESASVPPEVEFVAMGRLLALIKVFFTARLLVLHGSGPVVLLLALLAGVTGKRIILDSYAPRWIELEVLGATQGRMPQLKTRVLACFNVLRAVFAALVFDGNIVANGRQLDLYRGMMAPFTLTRDFSRVVLIPFGCSAELVHERHQGRALLAELSGGQISADDFVIGWLGGTYGWFDFDTVLAKVSEAIAINPRIKLVFFGVSAERQQELRALVAPAAQGHILFVPWVDFARRFDYWSGFDVSLVWGDTGVENDYASRTRNFDCLTLGLPIVQNWDEEWGPRLQESGAGRVTDAAQLSAVLTELSQAPDRLATMRSAMLQLAPDFYWSRFARQLMAMTSMPRLTRVRRLFGLLAFLLLLPAALVMFVYYAAKPQDLMCKNR